jgi:hypothetical protein
MWNSTVFVDRLVERSFRMLCIILSSFTLADGDAIPLEQGRDDRSNPESGVTYDSN